MSDPTPGTGGAEPRLTVIIVNYNTREMTRRCLRVLTDGLGDDLAAATEILVVDNASTDGSAGAIRESFPAVRLIESGRNAGFGAANNLAMQASRGRFFLLLNSDAFPRADAVAALLGFLERHPDVGVVGPRLLNEDGSLQQSCFRFTTPLLAWMENLWLTRAFGRHPALDDYRGWDHARERDVDFVIGACLLLRREVHERAGGFDERFFMYQEEADWQKRIHAAGWRVVFTPTAEVTHLAGASGRDDGARINRHFFESLDKYMLKHHGTLGFLLVRGAMLVGCSLRAAGFSLLALLAPGERRQRALRRVRLHGWLVRRQLFTGPPSAEGRGA